MMFKFLKRSHDPSNLPSPNRLVANFLEKLKNTGMTPKHIIDIGAHRGDWSRTALSVFPEANISLFEPQARLSSDLLDLQQHPRVKIHYKGVGDFDGFAPFTIHDRDDSCSFVYLEDAARDRGFTQTEIEVCQLDTALVDSIYGAPDIIKIDAEGYDLEVLSGAKVSLQSAEIVFIEASVSNQDYPNSVLTVAQKMHQLGYRLLDFTDLNRTPNRKFLWLVEAVFVRIGSQIDLATTVFD